MATLVVLAVIVILAIWVVASAVKIVRPTQRGLVERFGKYNRFASPGMHFMVPFAEKMYLVNITEQMVDAEPQEIITNDNLNATVEKVIGELIIKGMEIRAMLDGTKMNCSKSAKYDAQKTHVSRRPAPATGAGQTARSPARAR